MAGTIVVYKQLTFIRNRNLGFDKENLLYMPINGDLGRKVPALKAELKGNPLTEKFSLVSDLPTNIANGTVDINWEGKDPQLQVVFPNMWVSEDLLMFSK